MKSMGKKCQNSGTVCTWRTAKPDRNDQVKYQRESVSAGSRSGRKHFKADGNGSLTYISGSDSRCGW